MHSRCHFSTWSASNVLCNSAIGFSQGRWHVGDSSSHTSAQPAAAHSQIQSFVIGVGVSIIGSRVACKISRLFAYAATLFCLCSLLPLQMCYAFPAVWELEQK